MRLSEFWCRDERVRGRYKVITMVLVPMDFDSMRITTITIIFSLTANIIKELVFLLFPITVVPVVQKRISSKCELPHCAPGSILSLRLGPSIRGLIRSKRKPFKNSVTADISTTVKNISTKISAKSLHMCGASSIEDGHEAAYHIMRHLEYAQSMLEVIKEHPDETAEIIEWLSSVTLGEPTVRETCRTVKCGNFQVRIWEDHDDHVVNRNWELPEHLHPEIAQFIISLVADYSYYSHLHENIRLLPMVAASSRKLYTGELDISEVTVVMLNYNYSLGFKVDRWKLDCHINGVNGFYSRFNNEFSTHTTIELRYSLDDGAVRTKKKKARRHTFLVYMSGSVTQSGPGGPLMREAYLKFIQTISDLMPKIRYIDPDEPEIIDGPIMVTQTPPKQKKR